MQKCFFNGPLSLGPLCIEGDEFHHLKHVIRIRQGETILVLNGQGTTATATVANITSHAILLTLTHIQQAAPRSPSLTLIQATLSNNNNDFIIREATAIGATHLIFFESQHSESKIRDKMDRKRQRWQAIAMESCKQSGQPYLPTFHYYSTLADVPLSSYDIIITGSLLPSASPLKSLELSSAHHIAVIIGPEGDFSDTEYQLLQNTPHVFQTRFHPHVLRSETAALYALSVLEHLTQH